MKTLIATTTFILFSLLGFSQPLSENSLPDGSPFKIWNDQTKYTKTYFVATENAVASDENPGTEALPFKTIGKAASLVKAGEKVVIKAGIYREKVVPKFGGESNTAMISYEAASGEKVIITGEDKLTTAWEQPKVDLFKKGSNASDEVKAKIWTTKIPYSYFKEGNPFARINLTSWMLASLSGPRNIFHIGGIGQYFALKRGLMFINNNRITQVNNYKKLTESDEDYVFWVEDDGVTIHLKVKDASSPNKLDIGITTREQCFAPAHPGIGYIKVKGIIFEKGGNPFPIDQVALLSTSAGHHWIIENNTVRWANSIGIDIGKGHWTKANPEITGNHIVRNNLVQDNGICGIAGSSIDSCLIENNLLERNAFYPVEKYFENASIKTHGNRYTIIRNNKIIDTKFGSGIWMDYGNVNSRCSNNLVVNTNSIFGAIFIEGSVKKNLVDNNVVIKSTSSGIYQHDCDSLYVTNNLVMDAYKSGIRMSYHADRKMFGKLAQMKNNVITNNIIFNSDTLFSMKDADNFIDYNYTANKFNVVYEDSTVINPKWNQQLNKLDMKIAASLTGNDEKVVITFPKNQFGQNTYQMNKIPGPKGVFDKKRRTLTIPLTQGIKEK